ncbi:MAG: hypothetical protein ACQPRH_04000 [Solitalea-like symbiont of Tyrophagus putrescentiae]
MLVLKFITTTRVLPNFSFAYILVMVFILAMLLALIAFLFKKNRNHRILNIAILIIIGLGLYLITQVALIVDINKIAISYRLAPLQTKLSIINKNEIKKIYADDIINYNKPSLGGDINTYNYILGGKSVLIIQTNKDEYIRLSTNINKFELNNILSNYQYPKKE